MIDEKNKVWLSKSFFSHDERQNKLDELSDQVHDHDMNDCWTMCSYHVMEYELSILVDEGIKIEGFKKI